MVRALGARGANGTNAYDGGNVGWVYSAHHAGIRRVTTTRTTITPLRTAAHGSRSKSAITLPSHAGYYGDEHSTQFVEPQYPSIL